MITYTNIQQHNNEDFGAYLQRPGFSHSYLKQQKGGETPHFEVTDNVTIGKIVDVILTGNVTPEIYSHKMFEYCQQIANAIKLTFGPVLDASLKQVAFTADMQFGDFVMPSKGILDLLIPKHCVIDLKVTKSKDIRTLIKYMGYENQVWHYSRLAGVQKAYLMVYSIPNKKCELIEVDVTAPINNFWCEAILNFGRVKA